jgi:hypothetical protein
MCLIQENRVVATLCARVLINRTMRSSIFWNVMHRWFVVIYRRLETAYPHHLQGCPEMWVTNYKNAS